MRGFRKRNYLTANSIIRGTVFIVIKREKTSRGIWKISEQREKKVDWTWPRLENRGEGGNSGNTKYRIKHSKRDGGMRGG